MRIAVVGARGQLGAAVVHECGSDHEVIAFARADLDIGDEAAVGAAMTRVRPDVIVNGAAFTNVDAAEDHPVDALTINAFGVRALARAARTAGAALVHYSTDFVFDGAASAPYTEADRPNPQSTYAASKLLGEWFALDAPRAYVLRVESLFGRAPGAPPEKGSAAGIMSTRCSPAGRRRCSSIGRSRRPMSSTPRVRPGSSSSGRRRRACITASTRGGARGSNLRGSWRVSSASSRG